MQARHPLSALLSQALVAFIVEFDNEFEHQVPHRTTNHGSTSANPQSVPWLVSMAMWMKLMRFVPLDGITVGALYRVSHCSKDEFRVYLTRLSKWWGYVALDPVGAQLPAERLVRPTPGGRKAIEVWPLLTSQIEKRWEERFGDAAIARLRSSLQSIKEKLEDPVADFLPILGYDLFTTNAKQARSGITEQMLPALLSTLLLAFAIEFERELNFSLAICANVLRLAGASGFRLRDLPRLSGVSKEASAMAVDRLEKRGFAIVRPESVKSRFKVILLTPQGLRLQHQYRDLVCAIEKRWETKYGYEEVATLRLLLEKLTGDPNAERSPLFRGLEPYPGGWRSSVPKPQALPDYPMILHRGGFPDGS